MELAKRRRLGQESKRSRALLETASLGVLPRPTLEKQAANIGDIVKAVER